MLNRKVGLLIGAGGALIALALSGRRIVALASDGTIPRGVGFNGKGYPVLNKHRAYGSDPMLLAFIAEWERSGPFPVMIPTGGGNDRTAAHVAQNAASGASNASTLFDTPHGRGGAIDIYPAIVRNGKIVGIYLAEQPKTGAQAPVSQIRPDLFDIIARRAEAMKLQAGYRWQNKYGFGRYGDAPHVQVPHWKSMPFPPKIKAVS